MKTEDAGWDVLLGVVLTLGAFAILFFVVPALGADYAARHVGDGTALRTLSALLS